MSDLGLTPEVIVSALSQGRIEMSFVLAGLAISTYSLTLTFAQELQCIWKNKFSGITVLYLLIRYGIFLEMFVLAFSNLYVAKTVISCKVLLILGDVISVSSEFAFATFDVLRIWALYHHQRFGWAAVVLVFILSAFTPCINIYNLSQPQEISIISSGPLQGCIDMSKQQPYIYLPVITRAVSTAANLAVLAFTLLKTVNTLRESERLHIEAGLSRMLVLNGSLQFCTLLVSNIILMVLDILAIAVPEGWNSNATNFIYINEVLTSILLSMLLLDLRSMHLLDAAGNADTAISSVKFADAVLATMGATSNLSNPREYQMDSFVQEDIIEAQDENSIEA